MGIELRFECGDLLVEGAQHGHRGARGGRILGGDHPRPAELFGAQRGPDAGGLGVDVPATGPAQGGRDLGPAQPGRRGRVGGLAEQFEGIGGVEVVECFQRGREVLTQRVSQPLRLTGAFPDQRLVRAGNDFHRLGVGAVAGHRAELVGVGADHVGQRVCVGGVALGTGHRMALPVPGRLQRVDRIHDVAGCIQRRHPRTTVGLDPDPHLGVVAGVVAELCGDQRVQPCDSGTPFR